MLVSLNAQALIFLYTVIGGLFVGFIYDLFRISRKVFKPSNWVIYLQDIIFWFIVSIVIFITFFISNAGEIRGYAIIGIILGAILYACTMSFFIMKVSLKIINFITKLSKSIYKTLRRPVKLAFKAICAPFYMSYKTLVKIKKRINKIKQKFKSTIKMNLKHIKISLKKF